MKLFTQYGQWLSFLSLIYLLSACSSQPISSTHKTTEVDTNHHIQSNKKPDAEVHVQPGNQLSLALQREYHYWAGSPFRLGGNSRKGIDCSSLIQKVYKKAVKIDLPRTTRLQVKKGYSVKKSQLKVGDLVFFKTGRSSRHAGIYMGSNQFFHTSTSKGVIISDLNNPYWRKHYWQSRRVIK